MSPPARKPSPRRSTRKSTEENGPQDLDAKNDTDYSKHPVNAALTASDKIDLYRSMVRIRRFEEVSLKYYNMDKMGGFLHLYIGQEAVAVGCASLMGPHDHMITAYRDHGHALAVGMSMNECMAELFGKATGCSKGKGGSMHYFAPDKNFWGGHGIVGGQTPLGTGIAYAVKYQGLEGCCLTFMGDGAVNQGAFHESLNLAALWDLPVVFVIENNGYSMGTSQERSSAYPSCLAERAEGYDMYWDVFDGEHMYELRAGIARAMERAHKESRPSLVEVATYRYKGHSVADANALKYRTKEEVEKYQRDHDPIQLWGDQLISEGVLTEEMAADIHREARQEAEASARFADQSPFPEISDISTDVYYEVDHQTPAAAHGRYFFND